MHLPLQYTNIGRHDSEIFWVGGHFVSMDVKLNALNKIKTNKCGNLEVAYN